MGNDRDYGRGDRGGHRGYPGDGRPSAERERYDGDRYRGSDDSDRGFLDRAGDEVRSWFGDEEAERRRRFDESNDDRHDGHGSGRYDRDRGGRDGHVAPQNDRGYGQRDRSPYAAQGSGQSGYGRQPAGGSTGHAGGSDYDRWRQQQIDALDRDYADYRQENQSRFESEFGSWRTQRQTQRTHLQKASEHMDVVGSDGSHIGTVDKVRGDRIILTKSDTAAGGHHHSIPCSWIDTVDEKVKLTKTADEARQGWRDEERKQALFAEDEQRGEGPHILNRSFSGTYER